MCFSWVKAFYFHFLSLGGSLIMVKDFFDFSLFFLYIRPTVFTWVPIFTTGRENEQEHSMVWYHTTTVSCISFLIISITVWYGMVPCHTVAARLIWMLARMLHAWCTHKWKKYHSHGMVGLVSSCLVSGVISSIRRPVTSISHNNHHHASHQTPYTMYWFYHTVRR
jgi:hypothetical protein